MVRPAFSGHAPAGEHVEVHLGLGPLHQHARDRRAGAHPGAQRAADAGARARSGRLTMSDRNGVEPMLKVAPSRSISGAASPADHRSSATVVVREHDRHQHAVEEARLVGVGRAHEDHVAAGQADVVDEAPGRRQHGVGRVHDGLGLAGRARGVDQLDHLVGLAAAGRAASASRRRTGQAGRGRPSRRSSRPLPPTANTCFRFGRSERISRIIATWSKPRHERGTMATLASAKPSMKRSSRWRKIGISGLATAPMRLQAKNSAMNSHQFGSWKATTSPRPMPSRRGRRRSCRRARRARRR